MGRLIGVAALALLLGACSTYDTAKVAFTVKAAEVADEALVAAEWQMCVAATIGSVKRRYGMSVDRASLYRQFCNGEAEADLVGPAN